MMFKQSSKNLYVGGNLNWILVFNLKQFIIFLIKKI